MDFKTKTSGKLLNIEIGDRIIKVCVSERHGKSFQILDSFMLQTPTGAASDGQIVRPDDVAAAIAVKLDEEGHGDVKNVIFTLTSTKIATREVMLPPVKDNRLKAVVETNASDYFPVDMSNYRVSYSLLERIQDDNPGCRVLVMAAPIMLIDSYIQLAGAAGWQVEAIDFSGNSQYQVLRAIKSEGVIMYVDVNVNSTLVTFMNDGVLLLQRSFPAGGDEIITAAIHAGNRSDEEYLQTMNQARNAEFLDGMMDTEQQKDCLSRLISGVVRSADFFKSDHTDLPIVHVVLMGTCSHIAGLSQEISAEIGIETMLLSDLKGIMFVANSADGVSTYTACIGSLVAPLDLLPPEYRVEKKSLKLFKNGEDKDPVRTGITVGAVIAAVGLVLALFSVGRYIVNVTREKKLQSRIDELAYVQEICDTYVAYKKTDDTLNVIGQYSADANSQLAAFLEELEMKMPTSVLVMSAVCDEKGVSMDITTATMGDAAKAIAQLRTFDSIAIISTAGITETKSETGASTASFSVACEYKSAVEAEAAAAAASATDVQTTGNEG